MLAILISRAQHVTVSVPFHFSSYFASCHQVISFWKPLLCMFVCYNMFFYNTQPPWSEKKTLHPGVHATLFIFVIDFSWPFERNLHIGTCCWSQWWLRKEYICRGWRLKWPLLRMDMDMWVLRLDRLAYSSGLWGADLGWMGHWGAHSEKLDKKCVFKKEMLPGLPTPLQFYPGLPMPFGKNSIPPHYCVSKSYR